MTVSTLPPSPVPPLPELGLSVAEELAALKVALQALNRIITNYNAGGVTETYLEAASIALGNDASTVTSGAIGGVFEAVNNVQKAAFILTAVGAALDEKAADVGVYRKPAVPANTKACIAFYPNSPPGSTQVIPAGVILSAPNVNPALTPTLYQTTSTATVNVGATISTFANVECLSAGSIGNCPPGTVNAVVSGASGYTVSNVAAIGGGTDTEPDDGDPGLRQRALNAVPAASQSTAFALQQDALTYPGITSAVVYDLTSPPPDLIYPTLGMAQIFCDDGTGTLGVQTTTTATFTIPNAGLSFSIGIINPIAFNIGDSVSIVGVNALSAPVSLVGLVTASSSLAYTVQLSSIAAGNVGDVVSIGATVQSPNSAALDQLNADLNAGDWKAAGAEVHAWGSTQVAINLYMEVFLSQDYLAGIANEPEVIAAVQTALFQAVNALSIGRPVTLSMLIDTASDVSGVAEVPIRTVLINGVNADFGVTNGVVSLIPSQTCRIAQLSDVVVVNRLTVSYA